MAHHSGKSILSKRYAEALFSLANEKKAIDTVANDLRDVTSMVNESTALHVAFNSPVVSRSSLAQAVSDIAKKAKLHAITARFLQVLAENKRLPLLNAVLEAYDEQVLAHNGEINAHVTSARSLKKKELSDLAAEMKKVTGKKVNIQENVDEEILAGLVVRVGSQMLDSSLQGRLERMRLFLKDSKAA